MVQKNEVRIDIKLKWELLSYRNVICTALEYEKGRWASQTFKYILFELKFYYLHLLENQPTFSRLLV